MGSNIQHGAYALFLGCTIPARSRNYEMSARKVAEAVGLELVDLPEFTCCGFPLKAMEHKASLLANGRNLSIAEEKGLNIVSLCSSCTSALTEDALELNTKAELRKEINAELHKIGRQYNGTVSVKHFARVLWGRRRSRSHKKGYNKRPEHAQGGGSLRLPLFKTFRHL